MSWPHLYVHDNTATDAYSVGELPLVVLIDRDGRIAMRTNHTADIEAALDAMAASDTIAVAPLVPSLSELSDSTYHDLADSIRDIMPHSSPDMVIRDTLKLPVTEAVKAY